MELMSPRELYDLSRVTLFIGIGMVVAGAIWCRGTGQTEQTIAALNQRVVRLEYQLANARPVSNHNDNSFARS